MTRNLKTLGTAFVAMLALSAVAASAARATAADFRAGDGASSAEFTVEDHPEAAAQLFKSKAGNVSCNEFHATGKSPAGQTSSVTLENIKYGECTLAGIAVTVNFNAGAVPCHYTITSGDTEAVPGKSTGSKTLGPPNCTVKIGSALLKCNVSVPGGQTFEDSITYTNVQTLGKPEEITAHTTATGLHYQVLNASCPNGAGTATDGTIEGTVTMRGFSTSKVQQDLTLVDT